MTKKDGRIWNWIFIEDPKMLISGHLALKAYKA